MNRREVIAGLGSAAAWPVVAQTQQQTMPVIGFLNSRSEFDAKHLVAAFRRGLSEYGYIEGQTAIVEYRWALGQYERLPALAEDLVRRPVAVLVAAGGEPAALAAKAASSIIPTVFAVGGDPVQLGLVASYNRPGGNLTGISGMTSSLEPKRLGLLHELVPKAETIGVLLNPSFQPATQQMIDVQEAARVIGRRVQLVRASDESEIDAVFESLAQSHIAALLVAADPFYDTRRDKIVALAAHYALPTMYQIREYAVAGGLISYGIDFSEVYRQSGAYAGRILKGERPADLPVVQPTKFELVINLKTAKSLGLTIPETLLATADEVIQ
jgi:putative tryptophan/tyrosine transport system substrate-binding protein